MSKLELKRTEPDSEQPDSDSVEMPFLSNSPPVTEAGHTDSTSRWIFNDFPETILRDCTNVITAEAEKVKTGDLSGLESKLVSHTITLDAVFKCLINSAAKASAIPQIDTLLRLAFRAQAQARATVAVLHEMKFPKQASLIGQQNVTDQQQLNFRSSTRVRTRVRGENPQMLKRTIGGDR
jgi:hypothetical protein